MRLATRNEPGLFHEARSSGSVVMLVAPGAPHPRDRASTHRTTTALAAGRRT
jgi:hypothetical protein